MMKLLVVLVVLAEWLTPSTGVALTATSTATPIATPAPFRCVGDCDAAGGVSIDEVIVCVNIALGAAPPSTCVACDSDADGIVAIDELLATVASSVSGCGSDGFEPDDVPQQGHSIGCGELQRHALEPFGDQDWMRLSLDRLSSVVITTSGSQGGDPVMSLQDGSLSVLAYSDDFNSFFPTIQRRCGIDALPAGSYYVTMSGFGGSVVPEYDIQVICEPCSIPNPATPIPTPTPRVDAYEPDNTLDAAGQITCGEIQRHSFAVDFDVDWVTFTLGTRSTVHLLASTPGQYLQFELRSSAGAFLQYGFGALQRNCGLDALEAGTYAVSVSGYNLTEYTLAVLCDPCAEANPTLTPTPTFTPTATAIPPDPFEDDDAREQAVPVGCGEGIYRSISPLGDTDWLVLDVPERSSVVIQGYQGLNLALQDDRGRDLEYVYGYPLIARACGGNALEAGRYFIEVAPYYSSATFGYDLLVSCSPCGVPNPPTVVPPTRTPTPTPLVPDSYEPDDDPDAASALMCGTLQPHSLDTQFDQDWTEFTIAADSAVSIFAGVNFTLFNDAGTTLIDAYQSYEFTCQQPLPAGRYRLRTMCVFCGGPVVAYNLSLLCGACAPIPTAAPATATPTPTPTPSPTPT